MRATLVLGAGPGGTGPLVWAAQNGRLDRWLQAGVALIDREMAAGGTLGRYSINSDSRGAVYLECLDAPLGRSPLTPLRDDPATVALEPFRSGFPPLPLVHHYLHRLTAVIQESVARAPASSFEGGKTVRALHLQADGSIAAVLCGPDGRQRRIEARTAILALGGRQDVGAWTTGELAPGLRLSDCARDKIVPSDVLLTEGGLQRASAVLERAATRRIVILGGSHSAFSVAWVLIERLRQTMFGHGDIVMLMRRQPPIYYESLDQARADNYPATEDDVCPRTQRVNRFGGLRGDGREMWRRVTGRPGVTPEPRVAIMPMHGPGSSPAALRSLLDEAALVVPAFGYRATTVPVFDAHGRRLVLRAEQGGTLVDSGARVVLADGSALPNLFGVGLGTGYVPPPSMGGEASFRGQANSLWLYQNDIGATIYRGIQAQLDRVRPTRSSRGRAGAFAKVAVLQADN
jgi:hypothetical protein